MAGLREQGQRVTGGTRWLFLTRGLKESVCQHIAVMAAAAVFLWSTIPTRANEGNRKRSFTVEDSIELSYVVNPASLTTLGARAEQPIGAPIYSPDDKYFLLVTQRGILRANMLEGTIWLFDRQAVREYASGKSTTKPVPRKLATMRATTNLFVINDVRWIDGSKKLAFLGKDGSPYQQLFIVDVETASIRAVTKNGSYVTAYDMRDDTIVYTVLVQPAAVGGDMFAVGQRSILELLYPNPPAMQDFQAIDLVKYPSSLHLQNGGKELPVDFQDAGRPLRLFVPTLSLSPDKKSLITVAPVYEIPKDWEQYQPNGEPFRLKAGPVQITPNPAGVWWRPEHYVRVNLKTGSVSSVVDAPAGRDMGFNAPTEAFWFEDIRHVILTNTYRPSATALDKRTDTRWSERPIVAIVDTFTGKIQSSIDLTEAGVAAQLYYVVDSISWDQSNQELTIRYNSEDADATPRPEMYSLRGHEWVKVQGRYRNSGAESKQDLILSVRQDLNHPPALCAETNGNKSLSVLWDPNQQLEALNLGKASIYRWKDKKGRPWSGILALPPDYDARRRYPLVIQTHGYESEKFFADGTATSGSGGRALAAKDIVVLQMDMSLIDFSSPEEGPDNVAGFESAIDHLVSDGLIDRAYVGVTGYSRTSYHVLYALTHRPDLFATAIIANGNFSYVPYIMWSTGPGVNEMQKEAEAMNGGVPFGDDLAKWARNAPNFNLDRTVAPLLILSGERGELISHWETYSMLRRLGKPVELLWWSKENAAHILIQPSQRYASQQSAVDWFDFWLNGHEDPGSAKAEQYSRWRELSKARMTNQQATRQSSE